MVRARRVLEVGTLGGYSTIWLASALPADGRVVTLELEPKHAQIARHNVAHAGFADRVDVRVGRAIDSLDALIAERAAPFDLVFIDADKESNPLYFARALQLVAPGAVIIVDNVVRGGRIVDPACATDPQVVGVRELHALIAAEPRVTATAIQTVGVKGYDGFTIALVVA
jgi:predicted O-methyltransferase YrrM